MSARTTKMQRRAKEVEGEANEPVGRVTDNDRVKPSDCIDAPAGKEQSALGDAGQTVKAITQNIVGKHSSTGRSCRAPLMREPVQNGGG